MLPTATDNGGRLAAILPTGLTALAHGVGIDPIEVCAAATGLGVEKLRVAAPHAWAALLPKIQSLVVIVVDGLGTANFKARAGHAPHLSGLAMRRIETVAPSTTAAALTTITTGRLPAEHGLIGYRIMHPDLGLICPLRDWDGIVETRSWQRADPLFRAAREMGLRTIACGRPGHATSGFTQAMLTGAEFVGGPRIADRFVAAREQLATGDPSLVYVYVDELDRAGHHDGWESAAWTARLEQLDLALGDFLAGLPSHTGVILTADHGMVDIPQHQQVVFDRSSAEFSDVTAIGGEPRFRSFFLRPGRDPAAFTDMLRAREGKRAWVATRDEAFASGMFGAHADAAVRNRVGDVILAARGQVAYYASDDDPQSLDMVGQHGSLGDEERGVPLVLAGALAGSGFAKVLSEVAALRR